ncbi:MAG: hypothetical protein FJ220_07180, partial [Kiritimatiellaceae bacterium]|nr:hypothetical protein [Kiritimatiellaceae bacterium]
MKYLLFLVFCALAGSVSATEVERLLNEYRQIKTLTCQIRRTVSGQQGDIQFMSRVYWQNDDRFHAENLTPISRRIISDGTRFYSYAEGDSKGFSRPVNDLSERMLLSLRQIPGTPMDNLLRLVKYEEQILEPIDGLRRTAYRTEKQYVICQF